MSRGFFQTDNEVAISILTHLGPSAFAVYSILKMHADWESGECHPTYDLIVRETGLCRIKVKEYLHKLKDAGVIQFESRPGAKTVYTLIAPDEAVQKVNRFTKQTSSQSKPEAVHKVNRSGSQSKPEAVHKVNRSGSQSKPEAVHKVNRAYKDERDSLNETQGRDSLNDNQGTAPPRKRGEPPPTDAVWRSYSNAYILRWGAEPLRDAMVNGMLLKFIGRVGISDAPGIAEFYVKSNHDWYVKKRHDVRYLLQDASSLRTQWLTGKELSNPNSHARGQTLEDKAMEIQQRRDARKATQCT